jgi:hypothetical protein
MKEVFIKKLIERSQMCNESISKAVEKYELTSVKAEDSSTLEDLLEKCREVIEG